MQIHAEISSSKQDQGERLYWVEGIEKVEYKEIEKPLPIERKDYSLKLLGITHKELLLVKQYIRKKDLKFEELI